MSSWHLVDKDWLLERLLDELLLLLLRKELLLLLEELLRNWLLLLKKLLGRLARLRRNYHLRRWIRWSLAFEQLDDAVGLIILI